jgi:hypothetical protein
LVSFAAGGWHPEEHARFLSLLRRVKGDYSHLVLLAEEELPAFTRAQVRQEQSRGWGHPTCTTTSLCCTVQQLLKHACTA